MEFVYNTNWIPQEKNEVLFVFPKSSQNLFQFFDGNIHEYFLHLQKFPSIIKINDT